MKLRQNVRRRLLIVAGERVGSVARPSHCVAMGAPVYCVHRNERRATIMDDLDVSLTRGTLDLLILKALSWGPRHGYAVSDWIGQATGSALQLGEGTLYPALHRLERQQLVVAEWGLSEN